MKRQVSLEEISDGRLYARRDMAKIGCGGCRGCSACCRGMGVSAILDPMDADRISRGTGLPFSSFFEKQIELNVQEGVILPNLRMNEANEACGFLNEEGRCSIHPYRPGVCRLFPLGRYYEEKDGQTGFRYFVQVHECPAPNKTKVRIEKWLDLPDPAGYERAVLSWHDFLAGAQEKAERETDEETLKNISLYILQLFYLKPYDQTAEVYPQLEERLADARVVLDL